MGDRRRRTRRQWLGACSGAVGLAALAGCTGSDDASGNGNETETETETETDSDDGNGTESLGTDWPTYGGNRQNTSSHPDIEGPDGSQVTERAVADIGGITASRSRIPTVISDGTLYGTSTAGHIYALDLETEAIDWTWERYGATIVFDGTIYGPTSGRRGDYELYGYDIENREEWVSEPNGRINGLVCRPIPTADGILISSYEDVWRVDRETGEYTHLVETPVESRLATEWPALHDGTLYIGRDPDLYAIDVDDRTVEWTYRTDDGESIVASNPTVANGTVYGASSGDALHALDADSGEEVWSVDLEYGTGTSPAVTDDLVVIGESNHLLAVDAETGDIEWEIEDELISNPEDVVIADGICYLTTAYQIWAYHAASGELVWKYERPDGSDIRFLESPTIHDGTMYIPSSDETLYAIEDA